MNFVDICLYLLLTLNGSLIVALIVKELFFKGK